MQRKKASYPKGWLAFLLARLQTFRSSEVLEQLEPEKMMKKKDKDPRGVLVDAYWVAEEEAEQYIAQREELARAALAFFSTYCHSVSRDWAGSEDGEAVVGYTQAGEIRSLVHLDGLGIQMMTESRDLQEFHDALLYHNCISRQEYDRLVALKAQSDHAS